MAEEKLEFEIVTDESGAIKGLKRVQKETEKTEDGFKRGSKGAGGFMNSLKGLGGIIGGLGLAMGASELLSFGKSAIMAGAELEQTRIAFENIFGSVEAGNAQLDTFIEFANKTPFLTDEVVKVGQGLGVAGLKGEQLNETLANIGNISSATNANFTELGMVVNKVLSTGKVQGDAFNQFLERGVPITEALAHTMGVAAGEVRDLGAKGKVTSDDMLKALEAMNTGFTTSKGVYVEWGKSMKKQSETLSGLWSTLQGKFQNLVAKVSEGSNGALKGLISRFIEIVDILPKINFAPIFEPFQVWGSLIMDTFTSIFDALSFIGGEGNSTMETFQNIVNGLGIAFRVLLAPALTFINIGTTMIGVVSNVITEFGTLKQLLFDIGDLISAVFTFDVTKIGDAFNKVKASSAKAFSDVVGGELEKFIGKEKKLFTFGDSKLSDTFKGGATALGQANAIKGFFGGGTPIAGAGASTSTPSTVADKTKKAGANELKQGTQKATVINIDSLMKDTTININNGDSYEAVKENIIRLLVESTNRVV